MQELLCKATHIVFHFVEMFKRYGCSLFSKQLTFYMPSITVKKQRFQRKILTPYHFNSNTVDSQLIHTLKTTNFNDNLG